MLTCSSVYSHCVIEDLQLIVRVEDRIRFAVLRTKYGLRLGQVCGLTPTPAGHLHVDVTLAQFVEHLLEAAAFRIVSPGA